MGIFPQVKGGKEREEEEEKAAACVMQSEKCLAQSVTFARSIDCPDLGKEPERLINKHAMSVRTARLRRYRRVFVVLEERQEALALVPQQSYTNPSGVGTRNEAASFVREGLRCMLLAKQRIYIGSNISAWHNLQTLNAGALASSLT